MTDKEKISELKNLVDVLCDNISDQPAGCEACWLWEDGVCGKEALYKKMEEEKMLILPIKKKWYDMILSGEKKEEYREIKPYYRSRLYHEGFLDQYGLPTQRQSKVLFRNGYSKSSPSFEALCSLNIKTGREEWGAEPDKEYYVLKIMEIEG